MCIFRKPPHRKWIVSGQEWHLGDSVGLDTGGYGGAEMWSSLSTVPEAE